MTLAALCALLFEATVPNEPPYGEPYDEEDALGVESEVVAEHGRWAVYLVVTLWHPRGGGQVFDRVRNRIRDYATREDAEVARAWIQRGADRDRPFTNDRNE